MTYFTLRTITMNYELLQYPFINFHHIHYEISNTTAQHYMTSEHVIIAVNLLSAVQGGYVQLRDWTVMDQPCRKSSKHQNPRSKLDACLLRKTKPCWFYHHHPQGCPRADYECSYAHGAQEQRNRPDFKAVLDCSSFLENL